MQCTLESAELYRKRLYLQNKIKTATMTTMTTKEYTHIRFEDGTVWDLSEFWSGFRGETCSLSEEEMTGMCLKMSYLNPKMTKREIAVAVRHLIRHQENRLFEEKINNILEDLVFAVRE